MPITSTVRAEISVKLPRGVYNQTARNGELALVAVSEDKTISLSLLALVLDELSAAYEELRIAG